MEIPENYRGELYVTIFKTPDERYYATFGISAKEAVKDARARRKMEVDGGFVEHKCVGYYLRVNVDFFHKASKYVDKLKTDLEGPIEISDIVAQSEQAA